MGLFSFFGFGKGKLKTALQNDAVIIDVRTVHEFDQGKIPGSINIPLDKLAANMGRIKAIEKPIIICCASGMRSNQAITNLKRHGVKDLYNGGSWVSLLKLKNSL